MKEILIKIKKNAIFLTVSWSVLTYLFILGGVILLLLGLFVLPKSNTYPSDSTIPLFVWVFGLVLLCVGIIGLVYTLFFFKKRITNLVDKLEYFKQDFMFLKRNFVLRPVQYGFEVVKKTKLILDNLDDLIKAAKIEEKNIVALENPPENFLTTERLKLRVFNEEKDLDIVYKYRNDPVCNKYQSFSAFTKKEIKQLFIANKNPSFFKNGDSLFAIAKNEDDTLVGELYTSKVNDEFYLGFTIAPENQRQGYAFEIVSDLIVKIMLEIPDSKIFCSVFPKNIKSINLIKKLGFELVDKINSGDLGEVHIYQFKSLVEKNSNNKDNKQKNLNKNSTKTSNKKSDVKSNKTTKSTTKKK